MRGIKLTFALFILGFIMGGQVYAQDTTFTITDYGYVGIGTTVPGSKLQVQGSLGAGDIFRFSNHMFSTRVAEDNEAVDVAVFGSNEGTSGFEAGVYGRNYSPEGYGVFSEGNFGVTGSATFQGLVDAVGVNGQFRVHPFFGAPNGTTLLGAFTGFDAAPQLRFVGAGGDQDFIDIGQNPDGDFVIEGTDTPHLIVGRTTGDVSITGHVSANSINTGAEALKIVRGVIDSDGTILAGSGFTVTKDDVGIYTITFTEPFSDYPAVTGSTVNPGVVRIGTLAFGTTVSLHTQYISDAVNFDSIFTFMAIGSGALTPAKSAPVLSENK